MVMSGPVFFGPLRRSAAIFATVELPSAGGISSRPPLPGGDTLWMFVCVCVQSTDVCNGGAAGDWFTTQTVCCQVSSIFAFSILPSVLWRCWLGGRKSIRPVKNWAVGCWRGYLSGARCRLAYGPADATATHCLLLQLNPDWFYLSGTGSPG